MKRPIQKQDRLALVGLILFLVCGVMYVSLRPKSSRDTEPVQIYPGFHGTVPSEITIGNIAKKQVIFTFDCGGSAESANAVLEALAKHHVTGTFFMTGMFAAKYPDIVKRMAKEGHEIFNHTETHPHLTELSDGEIRQELAKLDFTIAQLTGASTQPYFRAPYGDRDQHVLAAAAQLGYRSVYWTTDALDWEESTGMTAQEVHDRILNNLKPGAIFLMHIGDSITGKILDQTFSEIESKGYKEASLTHGL